MSHRYTPPRSRVVDASEAERAPRPRVIDVALALVGLLVLLESYHQFKNLSEVDNGEMSGLAWLVDWIWVVVIAIVGWLLARGKGWARWALAAIMLNQFYQLANGLLFVSSFGSGFDEFLDPVSVWMLPLGSLFSLSAVILVFGPGRGWFAR